MPRQPVPILLLILVLSIPFYLWGAYAPVDGLPFGLPISFLMIFVPGGLALYFAWRGNGRQGVWDLLKRVLDLRQARPWALIFCLICMPLAAVLAFFSLRGLSLPLPTVSEVTGGEVMLMFGAYFLGAIPEELGWTALLTPPLAKLYGRVGAGVLIGGTWALWHVIPWSWAHPRPWILGMILLNILMRIAMLTAYQDGGRSLFTALVFHTLINVSFGFFANGGTHSLPWVVSAWLFVAVVGLIWMTHKPPRSSRQAMS